MENNNFKKEIKLIDRTEMYKGSIIDVYKDEVKVDDKTFYFDYIENSSASAIIPILPNGDMILVRQYRLAIDKWTLELPAGKLDDKNEDFLVCAKRELEEETGYKSDDLEFLLKLNSAVTFWKSECHIFVAKNLKKGNIHFDESEETKTEIWNVNDLKNEILNGNIIDSKTIAGIFAYIIKYGKN